MKILVMVKFCGINKEHLIVPVFTAVYDRRWEVSALGFYMALCAICYVVGIGFIGFSFYVQHLEDVRRPKGYHLKATVKKITELDNTKRKLQFSFFLFGKPITCTAIATLEESRPVRVGRDYFIVYDDETGTSIFNPCQKYRILQAVLIISGFFVTMFAVLLTILGVEFFT